ncbi:hypothetical protein D3C73_975560 [compost metagenome]
MVAIPKLSIDCSTAVRFSSDSRSSARMLETLLFASSFSWVTSSGSGCTSSAITVRSFSALGISIENDMTSLLMKCAYICTLSRLPIL